MAAALESFIPRRTVRVSRKSFPRTYLINVALFSNYHGFRLFSSGILPVALLFTRRIRGLAAF
jgi:hypothetical protein